MKKQLRKLLAAINGDKTMMKTLASRSGMTFEQVKELIFQQTN